MSISTDTNDNEIIRKVQIVGKGTIVISLPKKWAERFNVGKGKGKHDRVKLEILDSGDIIIKPPKADEKIGITPSKAIIACEQVKSNQHLAQLIVAAYLNGYEQIRIISKKSIKIETRNFVERLTSAVLNGYEVLEETEKTITIQGIMHLQAFNFPNFFKSYQTRIEVMIKDLITFISSEKKENREEIFQRIKHYNVVLNRNYFLLLRALYGGINDLSVARTIGIEAWEILDYYSVIFVAKRIGEIIYDIATALKNEFFDESKNTVKINLIENLEVGKERFVQLMKAFQNKNHSLASKIYSEYSSYKIESMNKWKRLIQISDLKPEEIEALQLVRKLRGYIYQIALFAINRSRKKLDSRQQ